MISSILALSSSGTSSSSSCGPQQVNVSKNQLGGRAQSIYQFRFFDRKWKWFLGLVHLLCLLGFFGSKLISDLVECCKNVLLIAYKSDPPTFSCTFCHQPSDLCIIFFCKNQNFNQKRSQYIHFLGRNTTYLDNFLSPTRDNLHPRPIININKSFTNFVWIENYSGLSSGEGVWREWAHVFWVYLLH